MKYTIKEKHDDPKMTVIEKTGIVADFTLAELEGNIRLNEKYEKEIKAKMEYEAAKMKNIEANHPFVLDMSEQDLFTAHMYMEAKSMVKVCSPKFDELTHQIDEDKAELALLLEKFPELAVVEAAPGENNQPTK